MLFQVPSYRGSIFLLFQWSSRRNYLRVGSFSYYTSRLHCTRCGKKNLFRFWHGSCSDCGQSPPKLYHRSESLSPYKLIILYNMKSMVEVMYYIRLRFWVIRVDRFAVPILLNWFFDRFTGICSSIIRILILLGRNFTFTGSTYIFDNFVYL